VLPSVGNPQNTLNVFTRNGTINLFVLAGELAAVTHVLQLEVTKKL
jgi:hypothetical protein